MRFTDRHDAGRKLAATLAGMDLADPMVLGLPRGGVPVAYEVARALDAPLDVLVARKIGAPFQPELGVGAIAPDATVLDERTLAALGLTRNDLEATIADERAELQRRLERYRGKEPLRDLTGRTVILVDDGLATGVTARAAIRSIRGAGRLILAVPTAAPETAAAMQGDVDDLVCLITPQNFRAVGLWYERFDQTSDETVIELLRRAREAVAGR